MTQKDALLSASKGKMREYGNAQASGIWFDFQAPEGSAIGGFIVRAQTYVDAIGVILKKRP
jgi:hypothetical protein